MDWFIIKENEHLGPFELETLHRLYAGGDILDESLIWKEGMNSPSAYGELFLSDPPNEPDDELPPALPLDAAMAFKSEEIVYADEQLSEEALPESSVDFTSTPRSKKYVLSAALTLLGVLVVAATAVFIFSGALMDFSRPAGMSLKDYERLTKNAQTFDGQPHFAFALASDRSQLWVSVNSFLAGPVYIKLKSIPGMTLAGKESVILESSSQLKNQLATFDKFEFDSGSRLIDGYYAVEVLTPVELSYPLLRKDILWSLNAFPADGEKQFRYYEEVLISSMEKEKFERLLEEQRNRNTSNQRRFEDELKQKYETLAAMIVMIRESFAELLLSEDSEPRAALKRFEQQYQEKYGRYFTDFVLQNDNEYEQLVNADFERKHLILAQFSQLSRFSKKIGELSMQALRALEEVAALDKGARSGATVKFDEVRSDILLRFDDLESQARDRARKLMQD